MKPAKFTYIAPEIAHIYDAMDKELASITSMTDREACEFYNVDSKEEAIEIITDYWLTESKGYKN